MDKPSLWSQRHWFFLGGLFIATCFYGANEVVTEFRAGNLQKAVEGIGACLLFLLLAVWLTRRPFQARKEYDAIYADTERRLRANRDRDLAGDHRPDRPPDPH